MVDNIKLTDIKSWLKYDQKLHGDHLVFNADLDIRPEFCNMPFRVNSTIIGICLDGEAMLTSNLKEFHITKGKLFMFDPTKIIEIREVRNFKVQALLTSSLEKQNIHIDIKNLMLVFLSFSNSSLVELSDYERQTLISLLTQIESETRCSEPTQFIENIIGTLISTLIYKIGDVFSRRLLVMEPQHVDVVSNSRAENYFKDFVMLLRDNYQRERSANFYACKLCVTPRHLSVVIKSFSRLSVREWIDNYVILEAKTLLRYTNMSVQEIAYHLNFPNQSFFGTYFKRITGLSPLQYRVG